MSTIHQSIATSLSVLALGIAPAWAQTSSPLVVAQAEQPNLEADGGGLPRPSAEDSAAGTPTTVPSLNNTPEVHEVECRPPCGPEATCVNGTCESNTPPSPQQQPPPPPPAAQTKAFSQEMMGDQSFIPPWTHTSDFVDTRLSFLFADQDVLVQPGQTTPNSPGPGIAGAGNTSQFTQFYDNFNTRYTGYETLSNLVLYKKGDTFFHGLSYEAALALTLQVLAGQNNPLTQSTSLQDASSYIRLKYTPDGWDIAKEGITFTAFPMSADRFRLGYSYAISWGGSSIFPNQGNSVPGAKLQINKDNWYAFVGGKTTLIFNEYIHDQATYYGVLAGGGIDILPTLRIEANGGYFEKGVNPEPQVLGVPVDARGVSAEAVYHVGQPIGYSVDFALYQNDPNGYVNFFKPESYPGGLSYTVSIEGDFLQQTLASSDVSGQTNVQNASSAALSARLKYDRLRLSLLAVYESLSFIQFNVPGFPPFFDFPQNTQESPETFVSVGGDYYFPAIHLTTGLITGLENPASFATSNLTTGNNPSPDVSGNRTVVVSSVNTFDVLPTNAKATLIYSVKGSARLQISEVVAAVGEVYYEYNNNQTTFKEDALGISEPSYQQANILGFNLLLQARF